MASVGEQLLEEMKSETPETVPDAPVVNETQDAPAEKPKRQRKPKSEVSDTPVETQEEPVAETADTPVTTDKPEFLKRLESDLGFQNVSDETEARDRLLDFALREKQERARLEAEYQQKLRDLQYQQTAAATKPAEPTSERKAWQPPVEYPAAATRYLDGVDEQGNAKWKPETPATVRAQAEQFVAYRDDMRDVLLNRPDVFFNELLPQIIKEHAQQIVEPFYEQRTEEQQKKAFFDSFAEENATWLYARDPATGQPSVGQLSRVGQLLDQRIAVHLERGYGPEEAIEYAQYDVQRQTGQSPWVKQAAPTPSDIRAENKQKTLRKPLNGAGSVPQRNGSFTEPESGRPQNGHLRAGELLRQAMQQGDV